jgi:hypothetical protein
VLLLLAGAVGCHGGSAGTPSATGPTGYAVVHGWPVLPEGRILGQATGVGVDSHNHVFVFHRAGREWSSPFPEGPIESSTVIAFDGATGEPVAEWGENLFVMPHGLTVDDKDNIWVTDVGRHQIFKFTHDGDLALTVGTVGIAGVGSRAVRPAARDCPRQQRAGVRGRSE